MKIGVISNRRSQRNKRGLPDLAALGARRAEVLHRPLDGISGLPETLRDLAAAEAGLLVINGGDGTVSATITELMERSPFATPPALAVVGGGMTNMVAGDVGLRGSGTKALKRLVSRVGLSDLEVEERDVMRLRYGAAKEPLYGMFFGTAAIYRAIVLCRETFHRMKLESSAATGATLAYILACRMFRRGGSNGLLRGDEMTVHLNGAAGERRHQLLALVTTLDRLVLKSRPYWGRESGALRYTAITYPTPHLARSAYRILYGGPDRRLAPEDYVSHNADRVAFEMSCPFTLDGELFEPEPGTPVELSNAGRLRFVRG